MIKLAVKAGDDPRDETWPPDEQKKIEKKKKSMFDHKLVFAVWELSEPALSTPKFLQERS